MLGAGGEAAASARAHTGAGATQFLGGFLLGLARETKMEISLRSAGSDHVTSCVRREPREQVDRKARRNPGAVNERSNWIEYIVGTQYNCMIGNTALVLYFWDLLLGGGAATNRRL